MDTGNTSIQIQPTVSDFASTGRKKWVMDQYLSGRYPYEIRAEYIQQYKLSDSSYDKDVQWVNQQLRKLGENEIEAIIERHTDRYNYVYKLAIEKGDLKAALLANKALEDLYKLHKPTSTGAVGTNIQVNNNNINLPAMSVDEIRNLLGRSQGQTIPITSTGTE